MKKEITSSVCDSYLRNLKLSRTDPLTHSLTGVGAGRCYLNGQNCENYTTTEHWSVIGISTHLDLFFEMFFTAGVRGVRARWGQGRRKHQFWAFASASERKHSQNRNQKFWKENIPRIEIWKGLQHGLRWLNTFALTRQQQAGITQAVAGLQ